MLIIYHYKLHIQTAKRGTIWCKKQWQNSKLNYVRYSFM